MNVKKSCIFPIECEYEGDGFYITHHTQHTCGSLIKIPTAVIDEVIKCMWWKERLDEAYRNKINSHFGLDSDTIKKQRIRRYYNRVFHLSFERRLELWGKPEYLIGAVISASRYGDIHKDGFIEFVGICPNYIIVLMNSSLFFPVVQMDTRFKTCIARRRFYGLVNSIDDETLLPLAFEGASSENKEYIIKIVAIL